MADKELGIKLKELRGKRSLRSIAEETGMSHTYIRAIELGENPATGAEIQPSFETLRKFSKVYSFPYDELMRLAGYSHKELEGSENRAFRDFDNTTEEERDYLKAQLEVFRNLKKK